MYCPGPFAERTTPLTRCSRSVTSARVTGIARVVIGSAASAGQIREDKPFVPSVLGSRIADRLPLQVRNRVGAATGERLNMILAVAGAGAGCEPRRGAKVLASRHGIDALSLTADLRNRGQWPAAR
jgi:hypothetical protein